MASTQSYVGIKTLSSTISEVRRGCVRVMQPEDLVYVDVLSQFEISLDYLLCFFLRGSFRVTEHHILVTFVVVQKRFDSSFGVAGTYMSPCGFAIFVIVGALPPSKYVKRHFILYLHFKRRLKILSQLRGRAESRAIASLVYALGEVS